MTKNKESKAEKARGPHIRAFMTPSPKVISQEMSINDAEVLMSRLGVRHLPVVENGRAIGIVSRRDIESGPALRDFTDISVRAVMTESPYTVTEDTPLIEVIREMARHKYGSTVICDDQKTVVGIFTAIDALHTLDGLLKEFWNTLDFSNCETWDINP